MNYKKKKPKKANKKIINKKPGVIPELERLYGIKKFVKTESGIILGAYIGNDLMHPRIIKLNENGKDFDIYYSTYEKSTFYYHKERIIASSDNIGDL